MFSPHILPGPPITNDTALVKLLEHGVTVGLGAVLESNGRIDQRQMHALAYTNLPKLLGVRDIDNYGLANEDMVAYEGGGAFDLSSKVVAVISPGRQVVDLT
ncbi:hypothetical protein H0H92_010996 [Tricholoma furcatifolium]|nr:hypothetical protein H0H92_010996 [Tricholoma furcatifolium]